MVVSVDGAPPGGHAVDEFATVSQTQAYAIGGDHGEDLGHVGSGSVGMPQGVGIGLLHFFPGPLTRFHCNTSINVGRKLFTSIGCASTVG